MRLLTAPTPNGWKVSIMIEELRDLGYPFSDLVVEFVDIMKGEQFGAEFMRVGPNQKIPALADGAFNLMESCAILEYLGEKFPSPLLPRELEPRFEVLQWVYWQAANVGPVFGNKLSYTRYMEEVDPAASPDPIAFSEQNGSSEVIDLWVERVEVRDGNGGNRHRARSEPFECGSSRWILRVAPGIQAILIPVRDRRRTRM